MPSTLVHIGIQAPLSRAGLAGADLKWVLAGCLLPDLPWIGRRLLSALDGAVDPYHLMAYAHAQATLASCLILAAALALLSRRPTRTWTILALGTAGHLLLDALEIKPGNGVHLLAPLDWRRLSLELVWPDGTVMVVLSVASMAYMVWAWLRIEREPPPTTWPSGPRLAAATALCALWLLAPLAFTGGPIGADTMSLATLLDREHRPGRVVACDRCPIEHRGDAAYAVTYAGEPLLLVGADLLEGADLSGVENASLRGRFIDAKTVAVELLRPHTAGGRDLLSVAGLAFILLWWMRDTLALWRQSRCEPTGSSGTTAG